MKDIETIEQALDWCRLYRVRVWFWEGVHVYARNGDCIGDGHTLLEAVKDAALFLSTHEIKETNP